jgi:hypothetical protein
MSYDIVRGPVAVQIPSYIQLTRYMHSLPNRQINAPCNYYKSPSSKQHFYLELTVTAANIKQTTLLIFISPVD